MKKILATVLAALTMLGGVRSYAQTAQYSLDMEPFSGVDVSGPFEVSLVRGSQYRVLVSVLEPYKDYVVCSVKGGVLTLTLDERKVPSEVKKQYRGKGTPDPFYEAIVYVPDLLRSVHLSGKAVLHDTEDLFDKSRAAFTLEGNSRLLSQRVSSMVFTLDMKGKSSADFTLDCSESEITLAGSSTLTLGGNAGKCSWSLQGSSKLSSNCAATQFTLGGKGNAGATLSGTAENAVFDLSGTVEVDASRLETPDADVKMSSVCKLNVNASQTLKLNLNGGSVLQFTGEPSIIVDNIRSSTVSRFKTLAASSGRL